MLLGLRRRGADVGYLRTSSGCEVDVLARFPDGWRNLVQVGADLSDPATCQRELRAVLVSLDRRGPKGDWPETLTWNNAVKWLLEGWARARLPTPAR